MGAKKLKHKELDTETKVKAIKIARDEDVSDRQAEEDYLVLTDKEADKMAEEYILDSLWSFNPRFLASVSGIPEELFSALQANDKCEGNNTALLALIEKLKIEEKLVKRAMSEDGRGHFISSYDGEEAEAKIDGETYYVYRTN